jgi:hypothetical protein
MNNWHYCETAHCRGGWAVTIHPAGRTLESFLGTANAARLIYLACYPNEKIPDFYCSNEEALADIRRRAASEKEAL